MGKIIRFPVERASFAPAHKLRFHWARLYLFPEWRVVRVIGADGQPLGEPTAAYVLRGRALLTWEYQEETDLAH